MPPGAVLGVPKKEGADCAGCEEEKPNEPPDEAPKRDGIDAAPKAAVDPNKGVDAVF